MAEEGDGRIISGWISQTYSFFMQTYDPKGVATARFSDSLSTTGWGVLEVETNPAYSDNDQVPQTKRFPSLFHCLCWEHVFFFLLFLIYLLSDVCGRLR